MPLEYELARDLCRKIFTVYPFDGKTQVTLANGKLVNALTSTQHTEDVELETIRAELTEKLFAPVLGDLSGVELLVNPTGRFVQEPVLTN